MVQNVITMHKKKKTKKKKETEETPETHNKEPKGEGCGRLIGGREVILQVPLQRGHQGGDGGVGIHHAPHVQQPLERAESRIQRRVRESRVDGIRDNDGRQRLPAAECMRQARLDLVHRAAVLLKHPLQHAPQEIAKPLGHVALQIAGQLGGQRLPQTPRDGRGRRGYIDQKLLGGREARHHRAQLLCNLAHHRRAIHEGPQEEIGKDSLEDSVHRLKHAGWTNKQK
jgi:hypothetical protein